MSTSLFEAPPYDPARERRRRRLAVVVVVVLLLAVGLFFRFRNWPYEHVVDRFFSALEQKNYEQAYGIWMADPDWKQHPDQYKRYPYGQFYLDWGPGGEWGIIKSYRIAGAARPPQGGSGVIVVVTVNERAEQARLWVEKKDKTLTFSPY